MDRFSEEEIRSAVRDRYGSIARSSDCGCAGSSCCGTSPSSAGLSAALGYSAEEVGAAPEGANLGLGCGNPQAIASLRPGETVVDLGSGGGFDCFLAARAVGKEGRVVGVDMTPDMISRSRASARKGKFANVEFRLGEIEHLPVADSFADVVISNCVINLSPDKPQVFREAFRVLKPGGRLAVADVVASGPLPEELKGDLSSYSACVTGAAAAEEVRRMLQDAGFGDIRVEPKEESRTFIKDWLPGTRLEDFVLSAVIEARRPPREA